MGIWVFRTKLFIWVVAYVCLVWVIGNSVYWSSIGVLMELSLWLPWKYRPDVPLQSEMFTLLFLGIALALASRSAIALITFHDRADPGETDSYEGGARFFVAPFSAGAWRLMLLFVVLAGVSFPKLEYERAVDEQGQIVDRLASWLDLRGVDISDGRSTFIESELLTGRVAVGRFLKCDYSGDLEIPVGSKYCTPPELRRIFEGEKARYNALNASIHRSDGVDPQRPRWWLTLLIFAWVSGVAVTLRSSGPA